MTIQELSIEQIKRVPLQKKIIDPRKLKPRKVILLAGPTGCGKTNLSLLLARQLNGEIVSADSMQVYREMDIGTAKVSEEERARIPHHLIDIRHVTEPFNVVDFYYEAKNAIDSILARGKVPLVVGGSGFYFRTLLHGPPAGPPPVAELREDIEKEMSKEGSEALYEKLKRTDPEYASTISANDRLKIIRALEIITLTGDTVSKLAISRDKLIPAYRFCAWFLYRPRVSLYKMIDERCEVMIESGLIDEVKKLEKQGLRQNPSASAAIGYRQVLDYLKTAQTPEDYNRFVEDFKRQSRHFAKRQFTWFRKEPLFRWLNVELHDFEIAAEIIAQDYVNTL